MDKNELLIIADLSEQSSLTMEELCEICEISPQFVRELVAYEIIAPQPFDLMELKRLQAAMRLQRHLDMNLASVAIVLDLLDELRELRAERELFRKHFMSSWAQDDKSQ